MSNKTKVTYDGLSFTLRPFTEDSKAALIVRAVAAYAKTAKIAVMKGDQEQIKAITNWKNRRYVIVRELTSQALGLTHNEYSYLWTCTDENYTDGTVGKDIGGIRARYGVKPIDAFGGSLERIGLLGNPWKYAHPRRDKLGAQIHKDLPQKLLTFKAQAKAYGENKPTLAGTKAERKSAALANVPAMPEITAKDVIATSVDNILADAKPA